MKLIWLPAALRSRRAQLDHIAADSPNAAIRQGDRISAAAAQLVDHPQSGRPGRVAGTRERVVPGTPFILVYSVTDERVLIVRVLHGAQAWPPAD
jgi:plasmid stabilization system protein ParE